MRVLALLLTAALVGCSVPDTRIPSLAPRAAEAVDPRMPVAEPQLSNIADAGLRRELAALVAQAEAGDAQFRAAAPAVERAASAAGPRESESWVVAQQALSALVAARGPVTRALGDIDELGAARIQRFGGIGAADMRALEAAAKRVAEIDASEAALIDRLQARLG